jgi:hypothetical protein
MVRYRKCAVTGCKDKNSTRHRFPNPKKYQELFRKWVEACYNPALRKLDPANIYNSHRVCHIHFSPEYHASNMYLRKGLATPSLNLPEEISLQNRLSM